MWYSKRRDQAERMKWVKKIMLILLIVLVVIQIFQPARNNSSEMLKTDISKTVIVPENIQHILKVSCYDCHSNNTNYPWYSKIQPFGWLLASHIKNGKAELNFSDFGSYSARRQSSKLNEILNSVRDDKMPLNSYTMVHKDARLSNDEKTLIIDWATRTKDSIR